VTLGVVFVPKSLKLLLASQVPEIKPEKYKIFKSDDFAIQIVNRTIRRKSGEK
jgi:hypothetical protein